MSSEGGSSSGSMNCKNLVVVLIGPPASGKSTFCQKVLEGARRPWTRICQDIINNGKHGTKAQCLKQASEILKKGQSVFIDRCNMTKEQRHAFVQLAGPQTEVHTVVLDLPAKLCIGRAVKRTAHEGGLQGGKSAAVINGMLQTKEAPILMEGFSRIMYCQTETDVENAINMYKELGPTDELPSGIHGLKSKDDKFHGGMMRFFKKEKDPQNSNSDGKSTEQLNSEESIQKNPENSDTKELGPTDELPSGIHGVKSKDDKFHGGMMRVFKKEKDPQNSNSDGKSTEQLNSQELIQKNPENSDTKELGPTDELPSGIHGLKGKDDKFHGGMMRFFKKEKDPQNSISDGKSTEQLNNQESIQKNPENSDTKDSKIISSITPLDRTATQRSVVQNYDCISSGISGDDFVPTLAFPSISTSDFHFDHEKAANIIVEEVSEFLRSHRDLNLRLVLVDLTQDSDMLRRVRSKADEKELDSKRFLTIVGDITMLHSKGGLKCNVIANASNWRLKAGGGGVNAAIFKAAGKELEVSTKERAKTLNPGSALVVPLSPGCSLCKNEGVTHVIHVLGPNMNPQRPNCLGGDYVKGCKVLRDTYSSLFKCFSSMFKAQQSFIPNREIMESKSLEKEIPAVKSYQAEETKVSGTRNAFAVLMQSSKKNSSCVSDNKLKRQDLSGPESNKRCKLDAPEHGPISEENALTDEVAELRFNSSGRWFSGYRNGTGSITTHKDQKVEHDIGKNNEGKKPWGSWAQALHEVALHPERNNTVLESTDSVVVLPDIYPKAKRHVLVVARLDGLDSLADVQVEHLPLLREIHSMGEKLATSFLQEDSTMIIRLGYHSVPSMRQLHLHVISQDFNSLHLKNKKHWNSFTTSFFRDSIDVIEEVKKAGKVEIINDKNILSMELRCHRCRSAHPNIPRLKSHISTCRVPFPASLSWGRNIFSLSPRESCLEVQVKEKQHQ